MFVVQALSPQRVRQTILPARLNNFDQSLSYQQCYQIVSWMCPAWYGGGLPWYCGGQLGRCTVPAMIFGSHCRVVVDAFLDEGGAAMISLEAVSNGWRQKVLTKSEDYAEFEAQSNY